MEPAHISLTFTGDPLPMDWECDPGGTSERIVRLILVVGFLAVLGLEAYLIWEGLSLL